MSCILLVEDHEDIRNLMTTQLQNHGYTVVGVCNGLEAVQAVAPATPSLILMDINMPELDGYEATTQIRAVHVGRHIPIIALTAYSLPGDAARAMAAGCDAFHTKPVRFQELLEQINKLIEIAVASDTMPRDTVASDKVASDAVASDAVASDAVASDAVASDAVASDAVASDADKGDSVAGDNIEGDNIEGDTVVS